MNDWVVFDSPKVLRNVLITAPFIIKIYTGLLYLRWRACVAASIIRLVTSLGCVMNTL